jgi:hypothetical protein
MISNANLHTRRILKIQLSHRDSKNLRNSKTTSTYLKTSPKQQRIETTQNMGLHKERKKLRTTPM